MLIKTWLLIAFMTLGMHGMYQTKEWTVTAVDHGLVTMQAEDTVVMIEEAEAWQVGDKAACIVDKNGKVITEFVSLKGR